MLRSMNDLEDYTIGATDGSIGQVSDFLFDDQAWVIRYLVVDTGVWLASRKVLISPIAIHHPNWAEKILSVSITKVQVKNSPEFDTHKPVSRQHETQYMGYYGYPSYWDGGGLWGAGMYPYMMFPGYGATISGDTEGSKTARLAIENAERAKHRNDDPHLRSCKEVIGYKLHASDGDIGHVAGLLVDEETWAVRYLIVDTSNWWVGHKVLIAPQWIRSVRWITETVSVDLSRQAVKAAPAYDSTAELNRQREIELYRHYERDDYWSDEKKRESDIAHS